jgi:hypothetical protein
MSNAAIALRDPAGIVSPTRLVPRGLVCLWRRATIHLSTFGVARLGTLHFDTSFSTTILSLF